MIILLLLIHLLLTISFFNYIVSIYLAGFFYLLLWLRSTMLFILQGIRATFGYQHDNREGILLERVLPNLRMPIQISSYELV